MGPPPPMGPPMGNFARLPPATTMQGSTTPPSTSPSKQQVSGVFLPGQRPTVPQSKLRVTPTTSTGADEKMDVEKLTDAVGSAGVDLKAEEDNILLDSEGLRARSAVVNKIPPRRSPSEVFLEMTILRSRVASIAKAHDLKNLDNEFLTYISMAAETRIRTLLEKMVETSKHRTTSTHLQDPPLAADGSPIYKQVVKRDVKKQLLAIERVEREQEMRRKEARAERERLANGQSDSGGNSVEGGIATTTDGAMIIGPDGRPKKKRKEGPGQAARNMSEDLRTRLSNQAALLSAGGAVKSWMMTGSLKKSTLQPNSPMPNSPKLGTIKQDPQSSSPARPGVNSLGQQISGKSGVLTAGSFIRMSGTKGVIPAGVHASQMGGPVVTLRDALFVLEQEAYSAEVPGTCRRVLMRGYVKKPE